MAFSAIYDLVIDERDVRIYSNGTGSPGADASGPRDPPRPAGRCLTGEVCEQDGRSLRLTCPAPAIAIRCAGRICAAFVDHLHRLVEHLASEPVDLVGCGFGGYLAASVAAKDPQLIARLVLENPTLPPRSGPTGQQPDGTRHGDQRRDDDAAARPDQTEHGSVSPARRPCWSSWRRPTRCGGNRCRRSPRPTLVIGSGATEPGTGRCSTCWPAPSPVPSSGPARLQARARQRSARLSARK